MLWHEMYPADRIPSREDIQEYLGEGRRLWDELTAYIADTYGVDPRPSFSRCSAQPGWNVKFKKGGRALCTLYPMDGYFIALVVVGAKEEDHVSAGAASGLFTDYVADLYSRTSASPLGRWLMIAVRERPIADDVRELLAIRMAPLQKKPRS